jgi:hypothetical protein
MLWFVSQLEVTGRQRQALLAILKICASIAEKYEQGATAGRQCGRPFSVCSSHCATRTT